MLSMQDLVEGSVLQKMSNPRPEPGVLHCRRGTIAPYLSTSLTPPRVLQDLGPPLKVRTEDRRLPPSGSQAHHRSAKMVQALPWVSCAEKAPDSQPPVSRGSAFTTFGGVQ